MTSSVPPRRCVFRLELRRSSREIGESKSDVINTVGVPQIQYIDRAVDTAVERGRGVFYSRERPVCVPEACDATSVKTVLDPSMDRQPWL